MPMLPAPHPPAQQPPAQQPPAQQPPPRQPLPQHLRGTSLQKGDRIYSLEIVQQPVRARMCGFGDKDRRPITPPPCIRLIVRDANTGNEVDPNEVDSSYFVLTVDLWNEAGTAEVNLVRHSSNSPAVSISTSTLTPYPPPADRAFISMLNHTQHMQMQQYQQTYGLHPNMPPHMNPYNPHAPTMQPGFYQQNAPPTPATHPAYYPPQAHGAPYMPPQSVPMPPQPMQPIAPATGMFTRNLIGSLSVNAFRLTDDKQNTGFWFVLQDLSVRTEGQFRLKMNFVDVGSGNNDNALNTGKAPVLATTYSDVFQVFSAKKFPGVIESTKLSKVFAAQGIKIPIRKDGPKTLANAEEYDEDKFENGN